MTSPAVEIDVDLPCDLSAAGLARGEVRRSLGGLLDQRALDDLCLVVSELVTNAIVHGQGAIGLRLQLDDGDVRGEVIDAGGGFEYKLREPELCATAGRGLLIVNQLTTRWGVHEGTTHVWFEILAGARGPDDASPHIGEEKRPLQLP